MQSYQHQAARPVSEVSHILMCGDRQEPLREAILLRRYPTRHPMPLPALCEAPLLVIIIQLWPRNDAAGESCLGNAVAAP